MRSPKSLHNPQHDEGGNYMAETETESVIQRCDRRLPSWNRITDRAHAPPFRKMDGSKPIKCRFAEGEGEETYVLL
jgi:hypothetical protein